jgi:hypothetical protein
VRWFKTVVLNRRTRRNNLSEREDSDQCVMGPRCRWDKLDGPDFLLHVECARFTTCA